MSEELFSRAAELQRHIKELKGELKECEEELKDIHATILKGKLTSLEYSFEPEKAPSREADTLWFKDNHPEFYREHAHVSNPVAVSLMADICGGMTQFQARLRDGRPEEFAKHATINIKDITDNFDEDTVKSFEDAGAIKSGEVKSYKVVPLPAYLVELNKKRAAGEVQS